MANFLALLAPASADEDETSANEPAWMEIARGELGVAEISGRQHNKRVIEYHSHTSLQASDDETPWCSSFANWVMDKAGYAGTNNAMAKSWLRWGVACEPFVGAVTVLNRGGDPRFGHVGFLVKWTASSVWLLGGNQDDQVCIRRFPRSQVVDFRKPRQWHQSNTVRAAAGEVVSQAGKHAADAATPQAESITDKATDLAMEHAPGLLQSLMTQRNLFLVLSTMFTIACIGFVAWLVWERLKKGDLVLPWKKKVG